MNNYNKLKELESELNFIKAGIVEDNPLFLDKLEINYCLYVTNIQTGEKGYVRSFDSEKVLFVVPATEAERLVTIDELNDLYIETPKHLIELNLVNPKFIVCPTDFITGVIVEEKEHSVLVDWGKIKEEIKNKDISWMSNIAGVKKLKKK